MIGLMDASARFEESQGFQFETFASQRIRGAMLDELRTERLAAAQHAQVAAHARDGHQQAGAIARAARRRRRRSPRRSGCPSPRTTSCCRTRAATSCCTSRTSHARTGDNVLERHLPDERENPFERCKDARFRAALVESIEDLPPREKLLLGLYYEQDLNFKEIAAVLGVSESRVCQLHGQAVARLRGKLGDW